eukprot:915134-Rhodomonas_salina.1
MLPRVDSILEGVGSELPSILPQGGHEEPQPHLHAVFTARHPVATFHDIVMNATMTALSTRLGIPLEDIEVTRIVSTGIRVSSPLEVSIIATLRLQSQWGL